MPTVNKQQQRKQSREALETIMNAAMESPRRDRMMRSRDVCDRSQVKRGLRQCAEFDTAHWPSHD